MIYWSGLYDETEGEQLVEGAKAMLKVAKEILVAQTMHQVNQLLLEDGDSRSSQGFRLKNSSTMGSGDDSFSCKKGKGWLLLGSGW